MLYGVERGERKGLI